MIGYIHNAAHDTMKLWKLWNPIQRGIIQATNIRFNEHSNAAARILAEDELPPGLSIEDTLFKLLLEPETAMNSAQFGTADCSIHPEHKP